jgi:hypothetical protein
MSVTQYDSLLKAIHDAHLFKRNKIPPETKVLACLLYTWLGYPTEG